MSSDIVIEEIVIKPWKSSIEMQHYDGFMVIYITHTDTPEPNLNLGYEHSFLHKLYKSLAQKVGVVVKDFVNKLFLHMDESFFNIFDGEDFIIPYGFSIPELGFNYDYSDAKFVYKITQERITLTLNDMRKEQTIKDLVREFIRQAEYFHEKGNFEMAIMNLSMASECFISKLLKDKGFPKKKLDKEFRNYESDYEKTMALEYFHFGFKKAYGKSLLEEKPDLFSVVEAIYKIRNAIAHGDNMYDRQILKINEIKYKDMFGFIRTLIFYFDETVNWINEQV
ncbi:HEPN domain-containing protein [Desulfitobacterium metallireducens]|uniref:HEPN domain-containing protein n=1 Tax=Desulfitobacterium metallireducens TaxID=142877 RepID=UPI00143C8B59|nr:HEPN domain-containing protein [Desulfitobacterium metallireducens]